MSRMDWEKATSQERVRVRGANPISKPKGKKKKPVGGHPPSQAQLSYLRELAAKTGWASATPTTSAAASQRISILRAELQRRQKPV